jgi:hypothetical protein
MLLSSDRQVVVDSQWISSGLEEDFAFLLCEVTTWVNSYRMHSLYRGRTISIESLVLTDSLWTDLVFRKRLCLSISMIPPARIAEKHISTHQICLLCV